MAIEYGFELGGPATAGQVAGILADAAASLADGEPGGPSLHLRSGVRVVTTGSTPPPFPDPVEEEFGFAPAVHVLFRFLKLTDALGLGDGMNRLAAGRLG